MVTSNLKLISKFQDEDFEVGEVVDAITSITSDEINRIMIIAIADKGGLHTKFYNTLLDFSEDWGFYEDCEDVIPKEPLIKDPKIRKAVIAWSEVNEFEPDYTVKYCLNCYSLISWQADIEFNGNIEGLEDGKEYTIEELCGDKEQ